MFTFATLKEIQLGAYLDWPPNFFGLRRPGNIQLFQEIPEIPDEQHAPADKIALGLDHLPFGSPEPKCNCVNLNQN